MSAREDLIRSVYAQKAMSQNDMEKLVDAYRAEVLREAAREFKAAAPLVFNGAEIALILEGVVTL